MLSFQDWFSNTCWEMSGILFIICIVLLQYFPFCVESTLIMPLKNIFPAVCRSHDDFVPSHSNRRLHTPSDQTGYNTLRGTESPAVSNIFSLHVFLGPETPWVYMVWPPMWRATETFSKMWSSGTAAWLLMAAACFSASTLTMVWTSSTEGTMMHLLACSPSSSLHWRPVTSSHMWFWMEVRMHSGHSYRKLKYHYMHI